MSSSDLSSLTIPGTARLAAERWGAEIALIQDGRSWTFAELWQDACAGAQALLREGVAKGDRVAIWAPNSREWILGALAAQIAGAAIVPLNTRFKQAEAADILRRSKASLLLTRQDFLGTDYVDAINKADLPLLRKIVALETWDSFAAAAAEGCQSEVLHALDRLGPDDVSDIIFTSGTTGAPKGAVTTHGQVIRLFETWAGCVDLRRQDRYLIINPFFHTFGYKAGWVACLIKGAMMVPMQTFDVAKVMSLIELLKISFFPGPPTIFQSLLDEVDDGAEFDSSSLRVSVTGAASIPPSLVHRMRSDLGIETVVTGYGMTECGVISMTSDRDDSDAIATTCGRPVPGLEVRCVNEEGQDVETGCVGEFLVRGYGVMKGYLDDPEATAATIDDDGWLHTGDLGTIDARGYLKVTDRKKDMYISGGFNCYPAEIERLMSAHPEISMVAITGTPDDRMGDVGKAFVMLKPGAVSTQADIVAWARQNMANYKVPREVVFVKALPLNASGKVLRHLLSGGGATG